MQDSEKTRVRPACPEARPVRSGRSAPRRTSLLLIATCIALVGWTASRFFQGPRPESILAGVEVPPSPVLTPQEAQSAFRTAPGFRVELVAAEPLLVDPVAMDWDDQGRLYVVEMRGFMRSLDADGEQEPSGRVVVLEDVDGDGRMDTSRVFLDHLVLPRAVAVLPEGVLIGAPPNLLLCRDDDADLHCGPHEQTRLTHYASDQGNVEHAENGLLPALDGWIYNAKSDRRFRLSLRDGQPHIDIGKTLARGQWGIAQDDEGRLYYNHNSHFLYTDLFPGEYVLRQPAEAARKRKPGIGVDLAKDEEVWGVRVAPGLNTARMPGTLRPDGRQKIPNGVSGLTVQRGHQFGSDHVGDAFVTESAGSVVAHFEIDSSGLETSATHRLYEDESWDKREFLASTDERFRAVDIKVGPDGALWVVDMYRGVVQHTNYLSEHLRRHATRQGLVTPGETGRIWRIVREDRPLKYRPPALDTLERQLTALEHPNGWVRDRAQRRLVFEADRGALPELRRLDRWSPRARRHVLWTLAGLDQLDLATWLDAIADKDAGVRRVALQAGESLIVGNALETKGAVLEALHDPDASVRLQAIHTLGELPIEHRPLNPLLAQARSRDKLVRQAVITSLNGIESSAWSRVLSERSDVDPAWIRRLTTSAQLRASARHADSSIMTDILDKADELAGRPYGLAIVRGLVDSQRVTGSNRHRLPSAHRLFQRETSGDFGEAVARARRAYTWPGDAMPSGTRPLTLAEQQRRHSGRRLYESTCASCHGSDGLGIAGLAPPLAGSPWVRDADDWLLRIVLQGMRGPVEVHGEHWDGVMPGFGNDSRFDDEGLAGLVTHVRRAWGYTDSPVSPDTVAAVRQATSDRKEAWTAAELGEIEIDHRLDRYIGVYRVPIVGLGFTIEREESRLMMGRENGARGPLVELAPGLFTGGGVWLDFQSDKRGQVKSADVTVYGQTVRVKRSALETRVADQR